MENHGLINNKTNIGNTRDESRNTFKKATSLKEIYEKNMIYPFVHKKKEEKNISSIGYSKNENKDNSKKENNEGDLYEEKADSS